MLIFVSLTLTRSLETTRTMFADDYGWGGPGQWPRGRADPLVTMGDCVGSLRRGGGASTWSVGAIFTLTMVTGGFSQHYTGRAKIDQKLISPLFIHKEVSGLEWDS